MKRMKPETKRKLAGLMALFLAAIMLLSSVSVLIFG